jgi:hypothetical protein
MVEYEELFKTLKSESPRDKRIGFSVTDRMAAD